MCLVSKDFKFCTCVEGSFRELPHYWVLHRFNEDKDLMIVGSVKMPLDHLLPNFDKNKRTIKKRLKSLDAFDKEMTFQQDDELEIVLNNNDEENTMTFCFKYDKGNWIETYYCYLGLESRYDIQDFGIIRDLIKQ
jgi:hypothetical protein